MWNKFAPRPSYETKLWLTQGCVAFHLTYCLDTVGKYQAICCVLRRCLFCQPSELEIMAHVRLSFLQIKRTSKNCLNIESGRRNLYLRKMQNFPSIILPQSSVFHLHLVLFYFHFQLYFHLQLHLAKWSLHFLLAKIILAAEDELEPANNIALLYRFCSRDGPGPAESGIYPFWWRKILFFRRARRPLK